MKKNILLWSPFVLLAIEIFCIFWSYKELFDCCMVYGGSLLLIISSLLWSVNRIKFGSINKEFNPSEKDAEEALAAEIETIKGNSLKKELVKHKLVREYIEKRHIEASQNADYLRSEYLSKLAHNCLLCGSILLTPFLVLTIPMSIMVVSDSNFSSFRLNVYLIFLVLAFGMFLWRRYYIMALLEVGALWWMAFT